MGNQTPRLSPMGNDLLPALLKWFPPAAGPPGAQEPLQQLSHPGVPGSGGRGMLARGEAGVPQRSARHSSVEHGTDGVGEWESPRTSLTTASPRRDSKAGGELGEEEVVLGVENLPLLAVPQEETLMLQPAQTSGDCASHQHPTPAPLHSGM